MTLNLLWSDEEFSYIIVDSARTHPGSPEFSHSSLGQTQRLPEKNVSVEEGVQKIIPLMGCAALGLCGNEIDILELASRYRSGLAEANIYTLIEYFNNLPKTARLSVSIGTAGAVPPFSVVNFPERQIVEVLRGHAHITGSLSEDPKNFLIHAIRHYLIENNLSIASEYRLAIGLAIAATMSVHYNLTNDLVGGAFFGARMDHQKFSWQPDMLYILYGPNFSKGLTLTATPDAPDGIKDAKNTNPRIDLIVCRVRDNVSIVVSSINRRGFSFCSPISDVDTYAWDNKWSNERSTNYYTNTAYIAFIPKIPGIVAVLPNDGKHVRVSSERVSLSEELVGLLQTKTKASKFDLKILAEPK